MFEYRLRRAVLHPSLVLSKDADGSETASEAGRSSLNVNDMINQFAQSENNDDSGASYAQSVLKNLSVDSDEECPICMDIMEEPVLIPLCMHKW